jgi:LPXTG-motif cell wall-anchored protein
VYNLAAELGDLGGDADFSYAPWTDRAPATDIIEPQQTVWFDTRLIHGFNGELMTCNLCARGTAPEGRVAALLDEGWDTGDLASVLGASGAGSPFSADPSDVEVVGIDDPGTAFTALVDGDEHHVTWTAVDGADGYEIYDRFTGRLLATVDGTTTSTVLPGDAAGYILGTVVGETVELRHPVAAVSATPPPAVVPDTVVAIVDQPIEIDVLANDGDETLEVVEVIQPEHGQVSCEADGTCTYTPEPGFEGIDQFEVVVEDADGVQTIQVVTVTVAPAGTNRPPSTVADTAVVDAGDEVSVEVLANDSDPDGDSLSVTSVTAASVGTVTCDGTCVFSAPAGFTGTARFTYTAADAVGATNQAAVVVTVREVTPPSTTTTTTTAVTTTTVPDEPTTTTTVPEDPTTTTTTVPDEPTTTTTVPDEPTTTTVPDEPSTTTTVPGQPTTTTTTTVVPGQPTTTAPTTSPVVPPATAPPTLPMTAPPPTPSTVPVVAPPTTAISPGSVGGGTLSGGVLRVNQGATLTVPLPAGTTAYTVVLYSTPVVLASGGAASSVVVQIPADTSVGRHSLVVFATVDGVQQVVGLEIEVTLSGRLPATGSESWNGVRLAVALLGLGAVLLAVRRRRTATVNREGQR